MIAHRIKMLWPPYRRQQEWLDAYLAIPEHREQWRQFGERVARFGFTVGK